MLKFSLKARLAAFVAFLWVKSLRIKLMLPKDFCPGVLGIWHCDLFAATAAFKQKGVYAMISESHDGEILANVAHKLGYVVVRGSDTHGAFSVRHLIKPLQNNQFVAMALDGPRGPAGEVKQGSLWLAKTTSRPIWLVNMNYKAHFKLKTWDNMILPLPFSVVYVQIKYFL